MDICWRVCAIISVTLGVGLVLPTQSKSVIVTKSRTSFKHLFLQIASIPNVANGGPQNDRRENGVFSSRSGVHCPQNPQNG